MKKSSNDPSHSAGESSNRVTATTGDFAFRLYDMIQDCADNSPEIAQWEPDGGFSIFDSEKLQETYFAKYQFLNKSTQLVTTFASFHRQLNLYGFSIEGTKVQHKQGLFHRGRIDLLSQINRRQTSKRYLPPPPPSTLMGNRPTEVESSSSSTSASGTAPSAPHLSTSTPEPSVNAVVVSTLSRLATETSELRVVVWSQTNRILAKLGQDDKTGSNNRMANIADASPMLSVSAASASYSQSTPSPPSPPLRTHSDPAKLLALHVTSPASGFLAGSISERGPQSTAGDFFRSGEKQGMSSSSTNRAFALSPAMSRLHGTWSRSSKHSLASTASGNTTAGVTAASDILEGNPLSDAASFSTSSGEMLATDDIEKVFDPLPGPDEKGDTQASVAYHPHEQQLQLNASRRGSNVRATTSPTLSEFQGPPRRQQTDKNPRATKRTRASKIEVSSDNADMKPATTNNDGNASGRVVWGGAQKYSSTVYRWDDEATAEEDDTADGHGNFERRRHLQQKAILEQRCSRCGTRVLLSAALVLLVVMVALQVLDVIMKANSKEETVSNTYNYFGYNETASSAATNSDTTHSPHPSSPSQHGILQPLSPPPSSLAPSHVPTSRPSSKPTPSPSANPTFGGKFERIVSIVKSAMLRIVPAGEWDDTYLIDGHDKWESQCWAAKWVAYKDPRRVSTNLPRTVLERFALATFFESTAGRGSDYYFIDGDTVVEGSDENVGEGNDEDLAGISFHFSEEPFLQVRRVEKMSWRKRHKFLSDRDVCHWQARLWKGVYCANDELGVTRLDLGQNNLVGSIPGELALLTNLSSIILRRNRLNGWIPTLLSSLTELRELHLSQNELTGSLPPSLFSRWKKMEKVYVNDNNFTGPLPPSLGALSKLRSIDFGSNNLTMTIPESFANLRNLERINLAFNDLTGTIPGSFRHLTRLRFLYLSRNGFGGSVPNGLLDWMKRLKRFSVAGNFLVGSLPVPNEPLLYLETFKVSANNFSGTIPNVLLERMPHLRWLEMANNLLSGTVPSNLGELVKGLERLRLTANQLSGSLPESLAQLTQLRHLIARENRLTGSLPGFLELMTSLEEVALGYNQLHGTIPSGMGALTGLELFSCDSNALSGTLPSELGQLKVLRRLNLSNNTIRGSIPSSFSELESLVALFLGDNQLTSTLPSELGRLTNLEVLELESNNLTGSVPSSFINLTKLRTVSLHQNRITGNITFLCQLPALEKIKADCIPESGETPKVVCDCCLRCGDKSG